MQEHYFLKPAAASATGKRLPVQSERYKPPLCSTALFTRNAWGKTTRGDTPE